MNILQSHVQDGQYFTSYTIEPILELLWAEDSTQTRYTVLFPITTPLIPQNPHIINGKHSSNIFLVFLSRIEIWIHSSLWFTDTIPEQRRFKFSFGPFATDVVLLSISFPTGVLSVSECISRGFQVMEDMSLNRTSKYFLLQIPFKDPVVQKMVKKK